MRRAHAAQFQINCGLWRALDGSWNSHSAYCNTILYRKRGRRGRAPVPDRVGAQLCVFRLGHRALDINRAPSHECVDLLAQRAVEQLQRRPKVPGQQEELARSVRVGVGKVLRCAREEATLRRTAARLGWDVQLHNRLL